MQPAHEEEPSLDSPASWESMDEISKGADRTPPRHAPNNPAALGSEGPGLPLTGLSALRQGGCRQSKPETLTI